MKQFWDDLKNFLMIAWFSFIVVAVPIFTYGYATRYNKAKNILLEEKAAKTLSTISLEKEKAEIEKQLLRDKAAMDAYKVTRESFRSDEDCFTYLFIRGLTNSESQVIYVPWGDNGALKKIKQGQIQGDQGE